MAKQVSKTVTLSVNPIAQAIAGVANLAGSPADVYDASVKGTKDNRADFAWRKRIEATAKDLEAVCTARQIETLEAIAVEAMDFRIVADGYRAAMKAHVSDLHPSGKVGAATYFPIVAALRVNVGDYAAKAYRDAVRELPGMKGELPNKGDDRAKGGIKGQTPSKWYQGVHRRVEELTERMGKAPTANINASALRAFTEAYKALLIADKALKKAIAE